MQDISRHDQDKLIRELKASNIELTKQNESFARLILNLQETVKELKDEINRLKGQKSRPKFPPL